MGSSLGLSLINFFNLTNPPTRSNAAYSSMDSIVVKHSPNSQSPRIVKTYGSAMRVAKAEMNIANADVLMH